MSEGSFVVREYKAEDKNFILATFLRGLYYGNEFYSMIPKDAFMTNYKSVAEALVNTKTIKVVCLEDSPDVILGYAIITNETAHWCFVKSAWRKQGIMKALFPVIPKFSTHFTIVGLLLMKKHNITFNPFLP
jgi:hypothetical protein